MNEQSVEFLTDDERQLTFPWIESVEDNIKSPEG